MLQPKLLNHLIKILDENHIAYMVTGSTILAKLRWAKLSGGSEKQFTDALRVFEVQAGELDLDYLEDCSIKPLTFKETC